MADFQQEDTPQAPPPKNKFPWVVVVLAFILMPLISLVLTEFVLIPRVRQAISEINPASENKTTAASPVKNSENLFSYEFNGIVVNIAGTMGTRYLKISFRISSSDPKAENSVKDNKAAIIDGILSILSSRTMIELESSGSRNDIRNALIDHMNTVLGAQMINELFFTEFVVQ